MIEPRIVAHYSSHVGKVDWLTFHFVYASTFFDVNTKSAYE